MKNGTVLLVELPEGSLKEIEAAINEALVANPDFHFIGFGHDLPSSCIVLACDPPTETKVAL